MAAAIASINLTCSISLGPEKGQWTSSHPNPSAYCLFPRRARFVPGSRLVARVYSARRAKLQTTSTPLPLSSTPDDRSPLLTACPRRIHWCSISAIQSSAWLRPPLDTPVIPATSPTDSSTQGLGFDIVYVPSLNKLHPTPPLPPLPIQLLIPTILAKTLPEMTEADVRSRNRLPTLFEVLSRRTLAPVDLFSFYIYMRDQQRSVDYLDFW